MSDKCYAQQVSDTMVCEVCSLTWDMNDPNPPPCPRSALIAVGGHKDDSGKEPVDLIDPEFLLEVAATLRLGAEKYAPFNWMKGMKWSRPLAALFRHLFAWMRGEEHDPETGLSHLAHVAVNVMFLMNFQRNGLGEDDRGYKGQASWTDNLP